MKRQWICFRIGIAALLQGLCASAQTFVFGGDGLASVTPNLSGNSSSSDGSLDISNVSAAGFGSISHLGNGVDAVGSASAIWSGKSDPFGLEVGVSTMANYPGQLPNSPAGDFLGYGASAGASAYASWNIDDLIFTGPASATLASINLSLSNTSVSEWGQLSLSVSIVDPSFSTSTGLVSGDSNGFLYSSGGTGLFEGISGGSGSFSTGQFVVPTGVPVSLSIILQGGASSSVGFGTEQANSTVGSISFSQLGPVFNLADGFSADAPSIYISGNNYSPVPEPEEYAAVAGLLLIGVAAYRRRRVSK